MYATAFAWPGCRGSREPAFVSASKWSFIFAASIALTAFWMPPHGWSLRHGVGVTRRGVGDSVGRGVMVAAGVEVARTDGTAVNAAGDVGAVATGAHALRSAIKARPSVAGRPTISG